jgi:glutaredoxin
LEIILYTRLGCHLCDDAKAMLESYGLTVQTVDIDGDPQWVERYGQCVPVVFVDGRERFRGRIDPVLLRRLLGRP